jgi:hypothetical protein
MKKSTNPGLARAGKPEFADAPINANGEFVPSQKLTSQSAGAKRAGDNRIQDFPDVTTSNGFESTGKSGAGSRKGSR